MVVRRSRLAVRSARLLAGRDPGRPAPVAVRDTANRPGRLVCAWGIPMTPYAELCVTSNFSFLRGASHPEELVSRAADLGLAAIAITDRNSVAGVVRAFSALKELARLRDEARATAEAAQDGPAIRSQRVTD